MLEGGQYPREAHTEEILICEPALRIRSDRPSAVSDVPAQSIVLHKETSTADEGGWCWLSQPKCACIVNNRAVEKS